jgi:hypothetical protein
VSSNPPGKSTAADVVELVAVKTASPPTDPGAMANAFVNEDVMSAR